MADVQHFSGKVTPIPASTAGCGLVVKPGAEPSTPEIGGLWYEAAKNCLAYFEAGGNGVYFPNTNGNAGEVLTSNGDAVPTFQVHPAHVAGGADKQIQVNNATAFGGISNGNADEVLVSNGAAAFPSFKVFGKLLHGVVPPVDATDGVNGDFFIDTATSTLYGPKAGGAWPGGVSIIGATGAAGSNGTNGTNGNGYVAVQSKPDATVNNVTTIQTLVAFDAMAAGVLNVLNRVLTIKVNGYYTTAGGEVPTLTFDLFMAASSRAQVVTPALAASQTNVPFELEFRFSTHGVDGGGALHRSAKVSLSLDGVAAPSTLLTLPNTTSVFDLTGALTPIVAITAGATNLASISAVISTLRVE